MGEEMLSLGQIGPEQITWLNLKQQYMCAFSLGPSVRFISTDFRLYCKYKLARNENCHYVLIVF